MKFLLKIVQGPNAGAEIALVEGMNLTFGCGDDCDIILSDTSVGEKAFELEVTGERVVAVMPGGKTVKLEPYRVTFVGASALAVGPQEGAWKSLVWPTMERASERADDAVEEAEVEEEPEAKPAGRRFPCGCVAALLVLLSVVAFAVWAWKKHPGKTKEYSREAWGKAKEVWRAASKRIKDAPAEVEAATVESLDDVAKDCGFVVERSGESVIAKGDFPSRVKRLEATARAYAAHPGLKVDFSDAESVASAVRELLSLVSGDSLSLDRLEGRKAFLSGRAASRGELEKVLRALGEDVPKITGVDCSRVSVGAVAEAAPVGDAANDGAVAPPSKRKEIKQGKSAPAMPIAGVLTVPYPCLVLNDGTRVMEGARFGEFTIEKIAPDRITVRGAEGPFEWRP